MKNATYFKAIMIPDSPGKIEVMISLSSTNHGSSPSSTGGWEHFQITSTSDTETWTLNCRGSIRLEHKAQSVRIDDGREERLVLLQLQDRLSRTDAACTKSIEQTSLYNELRENGIDYGKNFATIHKLRIGHCQAFGVVVTPDVKECMPSRYMQPHVIHTATFDALMHIVLPLYSRHCSSGPVMLTSIEEVSVAADIFNIAGAQLTVCCALSPSGPRANSVDVTAFQTEGVQSIRVVTLRGEKFQGICGGPSTTPAPLKTVLFHDPRRPIRLSIGTSGVLSSLAFVDDESSRSSLEPDEVEVKAHAFAVSQSDVEAIVGKDGDANSVGQAAGIITVVGSDLKHAFEVGERVCCWNTTTAFASYTRVKGSFVQKSPTSWLIDTSAALPANMTMAYYGLQECAQATNGQFILVHDAGGALGHLVVIIAGLLGLRVVATVKTKAEKDQILSLRNVSSEQIFDIDDFGLHKSVMLFTKGLGIDIVFNASAESLSTEVLAAVAPFGTVLDMAQPKSPIPFGPEMACRAIRYFSFNATELLRYRPTIACSAFERAMQLLHNEDMDTLLPKTTISMTDVTLAFRAVRTRTETGQIVLIADEGTLVPVRENATPARMVDMDRILQALNDLPVPQEQKEELYVLLRGNDNSWNNVHDADTAPGCSRDLSKVTTKAPQSLERRLKSVSTIGEARQIIMAAISDKISSLVALGTDRLDLYTSLADLGLDSLIAIEFKNWLTRSLAAVVRTHEILEAAGIDQLADLVTKRCSFVSTGLLEQYEDAADAGVDDVLNSSSNRYTNGNHRRVADVPLQGYVRKHSLSVTKNPIAQEKNGQRENDMSKFKVNVLPKYPFFDLNSLLDSYFTSVKALTTPEELSHTIHAIEAFKKSGSIGRILCERAATLATDPKTENWESELQLGAGYLNRRAPLVPFNSFWFSHPLSKRPHSQAERAALIAHTAIEYKSKLQAGLVEPMLLNEKELTTVYHDWIFNAMRNPCVGSDEMIKFPENDYCVVMWKGHAFKVNLVNRAGPLNIEELRQQFEYVLNQDLERAWTGILTCDNRQVWAEKHKELRPKAEASLATIKAAAFIVCLDDPAPSGATERARQFHFGGDEDAANRWNDKSLQFVVCSNGVSGVIGEHTMLDALTLSQLNDAVAMAIQNHKPGARHSRSTDPATTISALPLTLTASLSSHIEKVRANYIAANSSAEHKFLNYTTYGATFLRNLKCAPKSIFQIVVQITTLRLFGYSPACWETASVAHYHGGRVEIIQVILSAMAAFLDCLKSPTESSTSTSSSEQRGLLLSAMREHASNVTKASRGLGVDRNLSALRMLLHGDEQTPALYEDEVYKKTRLRKIMSHCFQTGMLEKGFLFRDPEAVWVHYEVYDESVYFSVTTPEADRATRFCDLLTEAADEVQRVLLV